jgi:hypothetical protein
MSSTLIDFVFSLYGVLRGPLSQRAWVRTQERDRGILNRNADELNREVEDVLGYQQDLGIGDGAEPGSGPSRAKV